MTKIDIMSVNHVCLVVRSMEAAEAFYVGLLGLQPHQRIKSWLVLNATSTLHLLHIPDAGSVDSSPRLAIQHFALQEAFLGQLLSTSNSGRSITLSCSFGSVREMTATTSSVVLGL
ncbi:MAG TPA: VOC family protein [Acidisoma sp.]|jgi:catechol 2,3-dioxygenase-like lactoylglutathione lyase family enzyme|nr:VOC family protein [Acidisoma sp.]